jgi:murein DD-endopeptidase MepM/ murein hydrolase activator NlpD
MRFKKRLVALSVSGILASTLTVSPALADGVPDYPGVSRVSIGADNASVKKMQQALIEIGYSISVANGKYGPQTTNAVARFYADNGDSDDGTSVGPIGWNEIFIALDEQKAATKVDKEFEEATAEEIAAKLNPESVEIPEGQRGKQPARGTASRSLPYKMPVVGQISAVYNQKGRRWAGRRHDGIDIRAPRGTLIKAIVPGEVIFAGWKKAYGRVVIIEHDDKTTSWYAHMSKRIAKKGQNLEVGDSIGLIGSSGHATGPHLHFETHNKNDEKMNPVTWLQQRVWKVAPAQTPEATPQSTETSGSTPQ